MAVPLIGIAARLLAGGARLGGRLSTNVVITSNVIGRNSRRMQQELKKLPRKAYLQFKSVTPKRSGNARRKTKLNRDTINANYPYAQRLDQGYSPKAPRGMIDPTLKYIRREVKRISRIR